MIKKIGFLSFVVLLMACGSTERVEVKDEDGGTMQYTRDKKDFSKQGKFVRFDSQGKKIEESNYLNDTLDGSRTLFSSSGQPEVIETYRRGEFHGPYKSYYESGQLQLQGDYIDNSMEGEWRVYYDSGELKEVVNFSKNMENGPFIEYYKNGKIKAKGTYLDGDNEHGLLEMYNEQGELVKKMNCEKGICRTSWTLESGDVE